MGSLKPLREPAEEVDVTTLLNRLTEIRAGYLDNLTNLDALVSEAKADLTTLETRLSDARATKLDNLDAPVSGAKADLTTLETRLSNTRAGYLNNLNNAELLNLPDLSTLTVARIAYLDKAISALVDLAQSDILSDATPFDGANIDGKISDRPTNPLLTNDARLDNLDAPVSGAKADLTTLETRLSAARATKLDNLDKAISALVDLAQSDILSDATPFAGANIAHLDADISSRSTLTQAQILSDAIPFDGANIDAPISGAKADLTTLETRLSDTRAGFLDNLDNAELLNIPDLTTLTAARIAKLDNLDKAISALNDISIADLAKAAFDTVGWIYVPSDDLLKIDATEYTQSSVTYAKQTEFTIPANISGDFRITVEIKMTEGVGHKTRARLYKNGVYIDGTEQIDEYTTYTELTWDVSGFAAGDTIEIWTAAKCNGSFSDVKIRNFSIYGASTYTAVKTEPTW